MSSGRTVLKAGDSKIIPSNNSVCSSSIVDDECQSTQLVDINKKRNTLAMTSHQTFNKLHKEATNFHHLNTLNSTKRQTVPTLNLGLLKEKYQTFTGKEFNLK